MGITQPAASAHVRALEALVEKPLFIRKARGVTPTAVADELARTIGPDIDRVQASLAAVKARSSALTGAVHLAGPAEFTGERLTPALASLTSLGLRVRLMTGDRTRIYTLLDEGVADLAVTASRPSGQALAFQEIERERLLLVAAPGLSRELAAAPLTPETLSAAPVAAYDEDLPLVREWFQAVFGVAPELQAAVTVPDLRIVDRLAAAGVGWTVLPDYLAADALRRGALVSVGEAERAPVNILFLVWNKGAVRQPRIVFARDHLLRYFSSAPT